ncbi:MAG: HAMP domain-containing histidine kinase, partial [Candidatus Dormibacteraeota bacterium]|nr:HAMP domain-containing histidine kinase [Candidatus Dormibacteraeota bacterium]
LHQAATSGAVLTTIQDSGVSLRVSVRQIPEGRLANLPATPRPAFIAAGQSAAPAVAQVNLLRLYLILGALLSLAAALAASWVVAGRALRPLDDMTETVEAIGSAQDLRRRLPEVGTGDEVGRLTGAFNAMMGRLDEAYSRLEGALDSQRRFVADASHELRTPLTSIRSNLGLLLGRADIAAADRAEALADMDTEAQRMSRLVTDLLTLARADAGQRLEMESLDLGRLGDEVVRQARRTYPGCPIELEGKDSPSVFGNADSLRQLLWILLDNAARHTDPGTAVRVTIDTEPAAIRLAVRDQGPGIPAAERERVFERFVRADPARSSGGAGLGLSIARWIVEQHGGQVWADANPIGKGATLTVELPRLPAPGARRPNGRLT